LDRAITAIAIAAHLVFERTKVFTRVVVPTGRIDPDLRVGLAAAILIRQESIERLFRDLRDGVPDGHVDGPDRHGSLAVPAGLLVGHQRLPDAKRVEVFARFIDQGARVGFPQTRKEALAHERALTVAAVGIEAIAD